MAIDASQHDLAEGDQTKQQRDRRGFGAEGGRLRLGPSPEFAIEIFERVRRAQRLPYCFSEIRS
jgi:hypothetical protein